MAREQEGERAERCQHDARRQPDRTITIFDNGASVDEQFRDIVVELDEDAMSASLVREYTPPTS